MIRRLLLAAVIAASAASSAQAISRYNINRMSCDHVQEILHSEGAAILRYTSQRSGMTLYDRYVGHGGWCEHPKVAKRASVPTADTDYCPVLMCKEPVFKFD